MFPDIRGPVAQWIRRLPTEQEIPGSIPGRIDMLIIEYKSFYVSTTLKIFVLAKLFGIKNNKMLTLKPSQVLILDIIIKND
jgi:hypothetical protein